MNAATKIHRIIDLQNEIDDLMHDLDTKHNVHLLTVEVRSEGRKEIQIFDSNRFAELYEHYDINGFSEKNDVFSVEIDDVTVFALVPKEVEETA